jgi:hypothetical protein
LAEGPGGVSIGTISEVLHGSASTEADPDWIAAVIAAIERELVVGVRRSRALTGSLGCPAADTRTSGGCGWMTSGWRERRMPAAGETMTG